MKQSKNHKSEFIEQFIVLASVSGINQSVLEEVSSNIYGHPKAYVTDFYLGFDDVLSDIEDELDQKLLDYAPIKETNSTTQKIRLALQKRIESVDHGFAVKLAEYYQGASGLRAGIESKIRTCDYIWRLAGDKSLDFNYYSKRGLLLFVYLSSWNIYVKTGSVDQTRDTMDKGLEQVLKLGANIGKLRDGLSYKLGGKMGDKLGGKMGDKLGDKLDAKNLAANQVKNLVKKLPESLVDKIPFLRLLA